MSRIGYKHNIVSKRLQCLYVYEKMKKLANNFMIIIIFDILLYVASDATFKFNITNY